MTTENSTLVNCGNDFYERFFAEVRALLDSGSVVKIYVDCIGHTRNNTVQEIYREKLVEQYGDKLVVAKDEGGYSYSYSYKLI